jgi:Cys-tRNA(Pro)/Cys-tRNA(Cys) deacylase
VSVSKKKPAAHGASTPALAQAQRAGVEHRIHSYEHEDSAAFGAEAARKLGVEAGRVFKTLMVSGHGGYALAVVPVPSQLDLKRAASAMGWKTASMADPRDAERRSGYVLGGISPLGQKTAVPLLLDESAAAYETVMVSGGRRGLEIELAPSDLLQLTGGKYAALARE